MKKICAMFLLFLISFVFVGCDSGSAYYFLFKKDSVNCEVGDTISIFELESSTNITSYEHMHIYTDDNKVAEINNNNLSVKLLKEGSVTVFVSGNYSNKFVSDSIVLNVVDGSSGLVGDGLDGSEGSNGENSGDEKEEDGDENLDDESVLSTKLVSENISGDRKVVCYNVLVNGENYSNFKYIVLDSTDNSYEICAYSSMLEIVYKVGSEIELEIVNKSNEKDKIVLNLS